MKIAQNIFDASGAFSISSVPVMRPKHGNKPLVTKIIDISLSSAIPEKKRENLWAKQQWSIPVFRATIASVVCCR